MNHSKETFRTPNYLCIFVSSWPMCAQKKMFHESHVHYQGKGMRFHDVSIQPHIMGVGIRTLSWVYLGRLGGFIRSFSPGAAAFSLAFASFFGFCLVYALLVRKVVSGQQSTGLSLRFTHLRHCATYSLCVLGHH